MASQQAIVFGVILPIVISTVVMLIAWRPWRPRNTSGALFRGQWGGGVAVGASYLTAHVGIHGWPSFDPAKAQHAAFWAALLGMIVGVATTIVQPRLIWRAVGRALGAVGMVWLVMRWKMTLGQWTLWELIWWVAVAAIGGAYFWTAALLLAREAEGESFERGGGDDDNEGSARSGFDMPFVLSGIVGLGAVLIGLNGHNVSMAQSTGALALATLACALMCLWRPEMSAARGAIAVAAPVFAVSVIDAALRSDLGFGYAMTLVCAPGLAIVGGMVVPREAHHLVRTGARVLGAAIPLGILVAIEVAKFLAERAEAAALGY